VGRRAQLSPAARSTSGLPRHEQVDRLGVKPECAADPKRRKLIPRAQPVDQGRADAEPGRDFANCQEPLVRSGIRVHLAHHGRTTRRLNTSAFCHAIRSGRLRATRDFRFLRRDATRRHAVEFRRCPFGTRGSQVQILSPRPIYVRISSTTARELARSGSSHTRSRSRCSGTSRAGRRACSGRDCSAPVPCRPAPRCRCGTGIRHPPAGAGNP